MKKYFYSFSLLGLIIYSCTTQQQTQATKAEFEPAKEEVSLETEKSIARGEALYEQRCGKCHDLFAVDNYTANDWKPIIERMAPKSKLTEEESTWILAYVKENAKK